MVFGTAGAAEVETWNRYPRALSVAPGALTALVLFWIMQWLVTVPLGVIVDPPPFIIKFERVIQDTPPETKSVDPLPKPQPIDPPPPMPRDAFDPLGEEGASVFEPPTEGVGLKIDPMTKGGGVGGSTGSPVPVVRVEPAYPPRALRAGIEGYVHVRFRVTQAGTVGEVEVIDARPPNIFEREAVRAVRKWRYTPGAAADMAPLEIRLNFELP